jgi:RNAse (barnase) inhibitor barstar
MFVAHLSGIKSKEELLRQLGNKLKLPDYFGFNWDALFDCLRDFSWIDQQGIILVHDDLPLLDEGTMTTYLQILKDAVQDWEEKREHSFEIVFPAEFEGIIRQYIENSILRL